MNNIDNPVSTDQFQILCKNVCIAFRNQKFLEHVIIESISSVAHSQITISSSGADLQESLSVLESWCSAWQLLVNTDKCRVLHLSFNNLSVQYTYNNTIFSDTTVSDLGVDVDSSKKYDGHINRIVAKAYSRIGILFRGFYRASAYCC